MTQDEFDAAYIARYIDYVTKPVDVRIDLYNEMKKEFIESGELKALFADKWSEPYFLTAHIGKIKSDFTFLLWKDHNMNRRLHLTAGEMKFKFKTWLTTKEQSYLEYYSPELIIRYFITGSTGLNCTLLERQFPNICGILVGLYTTHLNSIKQPQFV